jgi:hypothetical protein
MCTVIKKNQRVEIAKEDFNVYKALNDNLRSPYQGFLYVVDKLNETTMTVDDEFGCYDDPEYEYCIQIGMKNCRYVYKGFHSLRNPDLKRLSYNDEFIYTFIVPKGARYYENGVGNIVSDQIILKCKYEGVL